MADDDDEKDPQLKGVENDHKPWDFQGRPFQRVSSPSFGPERPILNGDGHARGTRRPDDFPNLTLLSIKDLFLPSGLRAVPAWVRTEAAGGVGTGAPGLAADQAAAAAAAPGPSELQQRLHHKGTKTFQQQLLDEPSSEHEVYGKMAGSFQAWTDAPLMQWHRWADWNLHVKPAKPFRWLRGRANRIHLTAPSDVEREKKGLPHERQGFVEGAMECEWDVGAFGEPPGAMVNQPFKGSQNIDWAWPMIDDWAWVAGRSIYDGGHETQNLSRSELHPCKAVAYVRKEARFFPEVGHHVPAIQLGFFAHRLGGYVDWATLTPADGKDYEFLVDMPLRPDEFLSANVHPVGKTPDFPVNRISLRPLRHVVHLDFDTHQNVKGEKLSPAVLAKDFAPEITIETPDPGKFHELQARIKIPIAKLAKQHPTVKSYGVIVSLAWEDPNKTQGKRVKRCRVNFGTFRPINSEDGGSKDSWRVNACVNNRWFQWQLDNVLGEMPPDFRPRVPFPNKGDTPDIARRKEQEFVARRIKERIAAEKVYNLALPQPIEFFLEETDSVRVHVHGTDRNVMDGVFDMSDDARTLKLNRAQVFAEATRTGQLGSAFPGGENVGDVIGDILIGAPAAVIRALQSLPVIGDLLETAELLFSALQGFLFGDTLSLTEIMSEPVIADWRSHIDIQPPRDGARAYVMQRVLARNALHVLAFTFKKENKPLGMCNPGRGFIEENALNPLPVAKDRDAKADPIRLLGLRLEDNDDLAELFGFIFNPAERSLYEARGRPLRRRVQYELDYTVEVSPQFPAAPPPAAPSGSPGGTGSPAPGAADQS